MKINFLFPHIKVNGGNKIIFALAEQLSQMGHEVITSVPSQNPIRRWAANLINRKPDWLRDLTTQIRVLRVKDFTDRYLPKVDITVAFSWQTAADLNVCSEKVGLKFYYILHDERLYHGPPTEVAKTYQAPMIQLAVSDWVIERIKRDFHSEPELLLSFIDDDFLNKKYPRNSTDKIRIILLHHSHAWKGTQEGVEIVQGLKKKYPQIELILFGARTEKVNIECEEYYYKPTRTELAKLYSGCDIYLCTSWDEGLGLPSMEAMACGCALATYDNGGNSHFAIDGQTALVAPRRNIEELSRKLEILVADKAIRDRIARDGRSFINSMPHWEELTRKLESIFLRELKKHDKGFNHNSNT